MEKELIARWETKGKKYWVELFDNKNGSFSSTEDNGGSYMGITTKENAIEEIELYIKDLRKDKINMKRVL
jgi:hypothetical protein